MHHTSLPLQLHVCMHTRAQAHTHLLVTWTSWRQNSCHGLTSLVQYMSVSRCARLVLEKCEQTQGKKTGPQELQQGVGAARLLQSVAYCSCRHQFAPAVTSSHLAGPGFVDSISGMLSPRVSQNKEPSRALNSDNKVTITHILDCLKRKVREGKKEKRSQRHKRKSGKILIRTFKGTKFTNLGTFSLCCF